MRVHPLGLLIINQPTGEPSYVDGVKKTSPKFGSGLAEWSHIMVLVSLSRPSLAAVMFLEVDEICATLGVCIAVCSVLPMCYSKKSEGLTCETHSSKYIMQVPVKSLLCAD